MFFLKLTLYNTKSNTKQALPHINSTYIYISFILESCTDHFADIND
jgi:hypothetical protein